MTNEKQEEIQRTKTICQGCGVDKAIGLVVCWRCFKYRVDIVPLKYFNGNYQEWLQQALINI